jgi:hypothetical protein
LVGPSACIICPEEAERACFQLEVTEREQREYFEMF